MSLLQGAGFTILPHLGGFAGAFITKDATKTWYKDLKKPVWTPPNWVFGPMWTSLYTGMGYASYLIYKESGGFSGSGKTALQLYAGQLALNWIWTPIFFGKKQFGLAALDLMTCWGMVAGCIYTFYPINKNASYLMIPYLAWLSLAGSINIYVWLKNPRESIKEK